MPGGGFVYATTYHYRYLKKSMKAVLVTIGNAGFTVPSFGSFNNVGDDRMQDGNIIGEQAEVISDLNLATITYRDLIPHLLQQIEMYRWFIQPAITQTADFEKAADKEKACLIRRRIRTHVNERATPFMPGELKLVRYHYPQIAALEVIHLGVDV